MPPEGWRDCRLGDLFENRKERGREGLPILSVTMTEGLVDREDLDRKQDSALSASEHLLVEPGDIAYNTMRMWQGAFGLAERTGIVSPAYVVLKPRPEVEPAYLAQLFRTPRMLHQFWAYSYGLTDDRLRLYFQDFSAIRVRVPPRHSQSRVSDVLSTWNRAIDVTNRLADNVELHCRLLAEKVIGLVDHDEQLSARLQRVQLRDVIGTVEAGVSVNGMDCPAKTGELGVLKISAVTSGVFDPSQNKLIRPDEAHRARVTPRADRIIVSRSNTAELVGASAYVECDHPSLFLPDTLWQLQRNSPSIHMRWLAIWLAMKSTRLKISSMASGSSGSMKKISKNQLLDMSLVLPPYARQQRIAEEIAAWRQAAENLRRQTRKLVLEKRALMQQLLTGRRDRHVAGAKVA